MDNKCEFCTEKCPQAERANQAALGRMYATNEFIALLKKVESGELVEVVRCKDCKWSEDYRGATLCNSPCGIFSKVKEDSFCSYGERKTE